MIVLRNPRDKHDHLRYCACGVAAGAADSVMQPPAPTANPWLSGGPL